jgi:hypothetical protein
VKKKCVSNKEKIGFTRPDNEFSEKVTPILGAVAEKMLSDSSSIKANQSRR